MLPFDEFIQKDDKSSLAYTTRRLSFGIQRGEKATERERERKGAGPRHHVMTTHVTA